jgi:hypothetical protein
MSNDGRHVPAAGQSEAVRQEVLGEDRRRSTCESQRERSTGGGGRGGRVGIITFTMTGISRQ